MRRIECILSQLRGPSPSPVTGTEAGRQSLLQEHPVFGEQSHLTDNQEENRVGKEGAAKGDLASFDPFDIFKYQVQRHPTKILYREKKGQRRERYAGDADLVVLEGDLITPKGSFPGGLAAERSQQTGPLTVKLKLKGGGEEEVMRGKGMENTVLIFMHPMGIMNMLPLPQALAAAGCHVLTMCTRYPNNDTMLIMEKCVLDMGAVVRHCKKKLQYRKVVLMGWSGGGALSFLYQSQAESPNITATPAQDPLDLRAAALLPADAVLSLAAHVARHVIFTEFLDPSVTDETNPEQNRIQRLDLYDPLNPNQPPYSAAYVHEFRAAQIARNRKITAWVLARLERLRRLNNPHIQDETFLVPCTMSDPRWMDLSVDPNGRQGPNHCFLGDPQAANWSPSGLARVCSLRSWLSQWSYDYSQADGPLHASRLSSSTPVMVLANGDDDGCTPSHTARWMQAVTFSGKKLVTVQRANHYYSHQPDKLAIACDEILRFLTDNRLIC